MTTTPTLRRSPIQLALRGLAVAALAGAPLLGLAANGYMPAGEFDDSVWIQMQQPLPSTVTAETSQQDLQPAVAAPPPAGQQVAHTTTRQQVREQLQQARDTGMMTRIGEVGDSEDVLQAREDFNAAQTEIMLAEQRAESEKVLAALSMRENELRIDETLAPGELVVEFTGEDESFEAVPAVWMSPELT